MLDENAVKAVKVDWYDDVDNGSYLLAEKAYNVKCECVGWVDDNTQKLRIVGKRCDVKRLVSDMQSGEIEPMCYQRDMCDEDYEKWLHSSVQDITSGKI